MHMCIVEIHRFSETVDRARQAMGDGVKVSSSLFSHAVRLTIRLNPFVCEVSHGDE
jgi:hypothetical protein